LGAQGGVGVESCKIVFLGGTSYSLVTDISMMCAVQ